jgi:hypothetical protein
MVVGEAFRRPSPQPLKRTRESWDIRLLDLQFGVHPPDKHASLTRFEFATERSIPSSACPTSERSGSCLPSTLDRCREAELVQTRTAADARRGKYIPLFND